MPASNFFSPAISNALKLHFKLCEAVLPPNAHVLEQGVPCLASVRASIALALFGLPACRERDRSAGMGKGQARRRKGGTKGARTPKKTSDTHTAAQLVAMAQSQLQDMEIDAAVRLLERCVQFPQQPRVPSAASAA